MIHTIPHCLLRWSRRRIQNTHSRCSTHAYIRVALCSTRTATCSSIIVCDIWYFRLWIAVRILEQTTVHVWKRTCQVLSVDACVVTKSYIALGYLKSHVQVYLSTEVHGRVLVYNMGYHIYIYIYHTKVFFFASSWFLTFFITTARSTLVLSDGALERAITPSSWCVRTSCRVPYHGSNICRVCIQCCIIQRTTINTHNKYRQVRVCSFFYSRAVHRQ